MKFMNIVVLGFIITLISLISCKKDNIQYSKFARIEITDAPIDDTNVKAVYVTISAIKLDGIAVDNFNSITVDLKSLQNGKTKLLTDTEIDLGNYKTMTLVLDYEKDDKGEYPGAYVLDEFANKHPLVTDNHEITLAYNYSVANANHINLLIDFDLRKAIVRAEKQNDNYDFANQGQLVSAIRLIDKDRTGTLQGNARNLIDNSGKTVVYVYKAGSYDPLAEQNVYSNKIEFGNAVTSAMVDGNGDYKINFLEEGDYIIEFALYDKDKSGKRYEFHGTYQQRHLSTLPNGVIKITPNNVTNVDLFLTGLQLI